MILSAYRSIKEHPTGELLCNSSKWYLLLSSIKNSPILLLPSTKYKVPFTPWDSKFVNWILVWLVLGIVVAVAKLEEEIPPIK